MKIRLDIGMRDAQKVLVKLNALLTGKKMLYTGEEGDETFTEPFINGRENGLTINLIHDNGATDQQCQHHMFHIGNIRNGDGIVVHHCVVADYCPRLERQAMAGHVDTTTFPSSDGTHNAVAAASQHILDQMVAARRSDGVKVLFDEE